LKISKARWNLGSMDSPYKFAPRARLLEFMRQAGNPSLINLAAGLPSVDCVPKAALKQAFDAAFGKATKGKVDRQSFDAQAFDAYILCYLGAVAAGSSNGGKIADRLREVSGPPGEKFTWMQLPEAVKALERGRDIDYEGASGPIDLNAQGDPTSGTYDSWKIAKAPYGSEHLAMGSCASSKEKLSNVTARTGCSGVVCTAYMRTARATFG